MKPDDHPVDRHQIAEEYRKRARLKEGHAGYWTGDLPEWRVSEYVWADIQVDQLEQYAHRAMMVARTLWKMAWALEHCVEHADCLANPELAKACLTDTLTPLHAICGPAGSLTCSSMVKRRPFGALVVAVGQRAGRLARRPPPRSRQ